MKKIVFLLVTAMVTFIFAGCPATTDGGGTTPTAQTINWTSATQVGGTDASVTSTGIDLIFDKAITGLAADNITVTGATKGVLTDNGGGKYNFAISNIIVANGANVTVEITGIPNVNVNPSSKDVVVYKATVPPPTETIGWTSAIQTGGTDGTTTSTGIDLVFAKAVTGLTADNITVIGATKGALTGSGTTYNLAISDITLANGANVWLDITGIPNITLNPTNMGAVIYKAPHPPVVNGDFEKGNSNDVAVDWTNDITWGHGDPWINEWGTFSVNAEENKQFEAGTANTVTAAIAPASISQVVSLPAGTYTAELQVTSEWDCVAGDMVKIEAITDSAVVGTQTYDLSNFASDWIEVKTPEFDLATTTDVTIKITFDMHTANAGTTIDDVTLVEVP